MGNYRLVASSVLLVVVVMMVSVLSVSAVRPGDRITVSDFPSTANTFYIANETYVFTLQPQYYVPLQVNRHIIYTATTNTVATLTRRALFQKRSQLFALAPQDHELLSRLFSGLPPYVRIDKKRSIQMSEDGVRRIDLAPQHFILYSESNSDESLKRADGVPLGSNLCLHIPFFTTCDNSADLAQVKNVIQAETDELNTELDSYKQTNNARDNEMTVTLNKQLSLVQQIAAQTADQLSLVQSLVSNEKSNLVQAQHGDEIIHFQVNALKRVTNSLLRFNNALGSTDPRSVVAQPAMAKLFQGFKLVLDQYKNESYIPILDSRTFDFTEQLLPNEVVKNVTSNPNPPISDQTIYRGFTVTLTYKCASAATFPPSYCRSDGTYAGASPDAKGYIYGAFHTNHYGLYQVLDTNGVPLTVTREAGYIVSNTSSVGFPNTPLFCVNFLGSVVLASFPNTPNLLNGIPNATVPLDMSQCDALTIRSNNANTTHYRLFAFTEGITVPFYSNCKREDLVTAGLSLPTGYLSAYPKVTTQPDSTDTFVWGLYEMHWVSSTCYINLEPEWIGMNYYVNQVPTVISKIPRGYRFNEFTINPAGELASSLEFLYTTGWALVYKIKRTSTDLSSPTSTGNHVIVDEVDVLDGDLVLFLQKSTSIIDESNDFYGVGNNGRDCIQLALEVPLANATFDYDLLDCFYQNDNLGYPIDTFVKGLSKTTGIARYNDKFTFSLSPATVHGLQSYTFQLNAKPDADFRFYIVTDTTTCPEILRRAVLDSSCEFDFFFSGSETVLMDGAPITFTNQTAYGVQVPAGNMTHTLSVGARACLSVSCMQTLSSTYVQLDTPKFEVLSEDDQNLLAKVYVNLDQLMQGTLSDLTKTEAAAFAASDKVRQIMALLGTINFNMTELFPYEDFTALRASVDATTNQIGASYCSSPFSSPTCFWQNFGATLIAIGSICVLIALGWLFCFRTKAGKALRQKMCKSYGDEEGIGDGYSSQPASPKPSSSSTGSDFQLLATN